MPNIFSWFFFCLETYLVIPALTVGIVALIPRYIITLSVWWFMMATFKAGLIILTTVICFINQGIKFCLKLSTCRCFLSARGARRAVCSRWNFDTVFFPAICFPAAFFCFSIFFRSASSSFSFRFFSRSLFLCSFASSCLTFFCSASRNSCRYSSMTQDLIITLVFFFFFNLSCSGHKRMSLR